MFAGKKSSAYGFPDARRRAEYDETRSKRQPVGASGILPIALGVFLTHHFLDNKFISKDRNADEGLLTYGLLSAGVPTSAALLWRGQQLDVPNGRGPCLAGCLLIRAVNTLLVFTGRRPGRYAPGPGSRGWSPHRGIPAPD